MWIFTKYGFFSAVCARQSSKPGAKVDPNLMMIRGRDRNHLVSLQNRFPGLISNLKIIENVGTDYLCRIFVPKVAWTEIAAELAQEIEYGNFKSEVAEYQGVKGAEYEHSLHEVWSVMYQLQLSNKNKLP